MAGGEGMINFASPLAGEDTETWCEAPCRSWRGGEAAHNLAPSPSFASRPFDKLRTGKLRYPLPQGERGQVAQ